MKIFIAITCLSLLVLTLALKEIPYSPANSFGMNKPHLLFHLGDRKKVASNFGFSYWQNTPNKKNQNNFSKLRLYYENTKNGLYVDMRSHDSDGHIHEHIDDRTYGVQTDIRYQMLSDGWEEHVHMRRE